VRGLLLDDLTATEWRILDNFEAKQYEPRRRVLTDGRHGSAYTWPVGEVLPHNWSAEEFAVHHLPAYAARRATIAAERDAPAC
jgi:hypothetical protein